MVGAGVEIDALCINVLRGLAVDGVQRANSGHPGLPLGAAPMAYALWTRHLRHNPANPNWFDRDRFILSAGHGSMLLYALLYATGYDLHLDDLKGFRQWGSRTPGHPENILTPGVEMATGPLGQGLATAVGMCIAERYLAARYNRPGAKVVDHRTYVLASDGDLMEGVSQEACSLAGHLGLGKLVVLYDDNRVTIDGPTDLSFSDDTQLRFEALGWRVLKAEGLNWRDVDSKLGDARGHSDRPTLIICRTVIGYGSPNKAGSSKSHGSPLGADEVRATKRALDLPEGEEFYFPEEAAQELRRALDRGREWEEQWLGQLAALREADEICAGEFERAISRRLPPGWDTPLPVFDAPLATRKASEITLNAIAQKLPDLIGGSADLAESVYSLIADGGAQSASSPGGRNIYFGVREHAMMAAVNGLSLHGGCRAFGGTFLIFSDYCRPALRLAALMETPSIFLFSHDSIGLGEDGPTHQPIEQLASLRAIPNFNLMRPADGNETAACWRVAISSQRTPSAIALTRQTVPNLTPASGPGHPAERGAYLLVERADAQVTLIGTGSELQHAVRAAELLAERGVRARVVSMPSWFVFEGQAPEYRSQVLPPSIPAVSVEAGSTLGWDRYSSAQVGLDRFGASAPGERAMMEFGFTAEHVAQTALELLSGHSRKGQVT